MERKDLCILYSFNDSFNKLFNDSLCVEVARVKITLVFVAQR